MNALRVAASVALLGAGFFGLYELVESPRSDAFAPVLRHGAGRVVALTFDDGPTRGVTDRVLDVLEHEHVPATFFVVGRAARRDPALLRRMAADGDEIENHSDTHAHLNAMLSPGALDAEIANTDAAIEAATGSRTRWLRPPFGARNAAVLDAARRHGKRVVLWSAMLDETLPNVPQAELAERLLRQVDDGAIIVLHDGDQGRPEAGGRAYEAALTPLIITGLRTRGYRFASLAELDPDASPRR
ncbi:MAG: peptidoglycan-N-acetylglucosamine deacetylase [Candidatus Eremiobacteraeota bacterium]|nr:peptidoglycan-N-acetylglucosamine deacetylase [Candidatus Eremiobacteraeota bacterium]